jgi:hypothetical protein
MVNVNKRLQVKKVLVTKTCKVEIVGFTRLLKFSTLYFEYSVVNLSTDHCRRCKRSHNHISP